MTTQGLEELNEDKFYGELDNIMFWCFELGFSAARREYGDQYKSAREAEPNYEDNLDSWIQDIITSHEELLTKARLEERRDVADFNELTRIGVEENNKRITTLIAQLKDK